MNGDDDVFADALSLPADERAAFLVQACPGDPGQRARIEALLGGYAGAEKFLNTPLVARIVAVPEEKPGDLIGRYKLLQKIGEGGMGVVYLASQEEPVRRRVALKIIKLGMDTKAVVTRFEAERQALAMMDHPNIARVIDGGATELGRPYFVMELVRGVKITEYCDDTELSTRARIELFITVCQAIQHAHQKGIIHRDIKPSNILVTVNDGVAMPKIIDFGIAKATEGRLTDETLVTQFDALIGTPAYMSPEQAVMTSVDIDTRSDIYSLGVLLYEILAGRPPFETKELLAAGLDELRKTIREKEPVRPSTSLATLPGEEQSIAAKRRSSDTSKLLRQLQGDLDWIVMKCLEKERARRYETANGLAADLKRHLNHEPVVARPPSNAYRFQKAFRRNKLVFAAGSAVALTLVAGLSFSTWSFLREHEARAGEAAQRQTAVEAQRKAEAAQASEAEQRRKAEAETIAAERHLYVARMNQAQQAWEKADIARLRQLLEETREDPNRGFEWYYWQRETHRALMTLRGYLSNDANVWSVAFSPDGRWIATGNGDSNVRLWDAATYEEIRILRKDRSNAFVAVAFSPDSSRVVGGNRDKTVTVWSVPDGQELFTFSGHVENITSAVYSPDGRQIVTASDDRTAKLWDANTGEELRTFTGHTAAVHSVAFSPDGDRIVTGSGNFDPLTQNAKIWDVRTGKGLFTLKGHSRPISAVAFSPDGRWIVTGSGDSTAKVWDTTTGEEVRTLTGHTSQIRSVAFSPNGLIVTAGDDATIRVWNAASGGQLSIHKGHEGGVLAVAFSPDGNRIVSGGGSVGSRDKTAKVWDRSKGSGPFSFKGNEVRVGAVAFSPGGQRILTGGGDRTAKVWDASSGRELLTFNGHTAPVTSAAYSRDGSQIVTTSFDQTARIWDATGSRKPLTLEGHSAPVFSAAFSPDGKTIVTGSQDGTVRLWETATARELFLIKGTAGFTSVAYSPDGRRIATGSYDHTARVWDAVNGREVCTLIGHTGYVTAVAFSPDGQAIVTGSTDKTARVWDAGSGREQLTMKGHLYPISSVAYSPDGQRIVTGSDDMSVRVWESTTGQELLTLSGHDAPVTAASFSPDGRQIVTGGGLDRTTKIWHSASAAQVVEWRKEEAAVAQKITALAATRPGLPPFNQVTTTAAEYLSALRREWTPEERERYSRAGDEGAIKRWLVLGPKVRNVDDSFTQARRKEEEPRISLMTPREGQRTALAGSDLTWRAITLDSYVFDFVAVTGRFTDSSAAYAMCYVWSEVEQSGLHLLIGTEGWAVLFLNGQMLHQHRSPRGYGADLDRKKDVTLKAGRNVLTLKVSGDLGTWRLRNSIRFTDAAGNPVKGIRVTLDPDSAK